MKKLIIIGAIMLAGCSTQASRMQACEDQGVSRDTCYLAEQNRTNMINAAAEKQALENAARQYGEAAHKHPHKSAANGCTQVDDANGLCDEHSTKANVKPFIKHVGDVEIKRDKLGLVSIDGKPAVEIENEGGNVSYEAGIFIVTIYGKTGKVALSKDRQFVAFAK